MNKLPLGLAYFSLLGILFLGLFFISCKKDLDLEGEVVLVEKELILDCEITFPGTHTITIYQSESDLLSDENRLQIQNEKINSPIGIKTFYFRKIESDEIFVKLSVINNNGSVDKLLQYQNSIIFPDYNLVLTRRIKASEWIEI